jgi:hypothetical protein
MLLDKLALRDSLEHSSSTWMAEGDWSVMSWCTDGAWSATTSGSKPKSYNETKPSGSYYNALVLKNYQAVAYTRSLGYDSEKRYWSLWLCYEDATYSGYRASFVTTKNETGKGCKVTIYKVSEGTETELATVEIEAKALDAYALLLEDRKLSVWRKPSGGEWGKVLAATDSGTPFIEGHVGVDGSGTDPKFTALEIAGEYAAFGELLEDRLEPWLIAWPDSDLKVFLEAIAQMAEPLASIIEDGWNPILSPAEFPNSEDFTRPAYPRRFNPAYLAQFVGVTIPTQDDYASAVSLIQEEPGFKRATSEAISKAVARALKPGAGTPRIYSRQNANGEAKAYWFVVAVSAKDVEGSIVTTGNITSGSAKIKGIPNTTGMEAGDPVLALGFSPPPTIKEVNSSTEITLTANATVTTEGAQVLVVDQAGIGMVENNILEAKPAGLRFVLLYSGTYAELEGLFTKYSSAESAYGSYALLELNA